MAGGATVVKNRYQVECLDRHARVVDSETNSVILFWPLRHDEHSRERANEVAVILNTMDKRMRELEDEIHDVETGWRQRR